MMNNLRRPIVLAYLPNLLEGLGVNDPNDVFRFAMAGSGEEDYLMTGNRRVGLLQLGSC